MLAQLPLGLKNVHGGHGYGIRNAEGERILEFGLALDMTVCNTMFQKRDSRLITFSSGGSNTQIDYIMMKNKDKRLLRDVKVIPSEEVVTQHKLVVCDLNICIKQERKKPYTQKIKIWKLKDTGTANKYASEFRDRWPGSEATESVEETWCKLKTSLSDTSESVCGRTKGPARRKTTYWWDDSVDVAIKEKRRLWKAWKKGNCTKDKYIAAKRIAKRQVYIAKTNAAALQFGGLVTDKNCRENAFRVARQMLVQNKDVTCEACVTEKQ